MSTRKTYNKVGELSSMRRLLCLVGDGFSDSEINQAKSILERAFADWKDITVLITNNQFKPVKVDIEAWERMEKDLDG